MSQSTTLMKRANRKEFRTHGRLPLTDQRKNNSIMISAHLKIKRTSIAQIARELGIRQDVALRAAQGVVKNNRVTARLKALGIPDMYLVSNGASE